MISASGDPGSTLWSYSQRAPSGIDIRIDSIRPPVLSPATPECWLPSVSPSHKSRATPSHVSSILKPIDSKPLRSRLRDQSYRDAGLYTGYRPASPHPCILTGGQVWGKAYGHPSRSRNGDGSPGRRPLDARLHACLRSTKAWNQPIKHWLSDILFKDCPG